MKWDSKEILLVGSIISSTKDYLYAHEIDITDQTNFDKLLSKGYSSNWENSTISNSDKQFLLEELDSLINSKDSFYVLQYQGIHYHYSKDDLIQIKNLTIGFVVNSDFHY